MKTLLVVPVYNCEPVIEGVLKSLLEKTQRPILVVDDGSLVPVTNPQPDRIDILRLPENQGKGVALRKAFAWALEKEFSHVLSFDGDGQHRAEDVSELLQVSQSHPKDIVIGCRKFDDSVPGISRFGRKFSNFWVWYQTSIRVGDSQSGLRVYPLHSLTELKFFSRRYDFEIEILVRAIWRGLKVQDVDVSVIYPSEEERISHFDKLWDNVRITGLNILLIIYSLIFQHRSLPRVLAAGGVSFLSSLFLSPLWGLIFGLFACLVLRLNVILFLVGFLVLSMT